MKQKLPKKNFSSKNLDLDEIQKAQNFLNSCTKWSLIRFLIAIFSNKQNLNNLFDFQIITSLLLHDLRNSKKKKSFVLNNLLLFTLPFFIYFLNTKSLVEQPNLNFTKIQGQIHYKKNYIGICKKYFYFLNTKFDIFLHNFFSLKKNYINKKTSLLNLKKVNFVLKKKENVNLHWWKILILEEIISNWKLSKEYLSKVEKLLKKKSIDDLKCFFEFYINHKISNHNYNDWEYYFHSNFFNQFTKNQKKENFNQNSLFFDIILAFCEKLLFEIEFLSKQENFNLKDELNDFEPNFYLKILTDDSHWWKKKFFQNFSFWGESDNIAINSYLLIKEKGNFYFKNYVEFFLWELYQNSFFDLKQKKNLIRIKKSSQYLSIFYILKNPDCFLTVEDVFSSLIYKFCKYILYKEKKDNKILKKNLNENFIYIKKDKFFDFFYKLRFNEHFKFDSNKSIFDWIKKKFYIQNRPFIKSLVTYSTISNESFFSLKKKEKNLSLFINNFNKNLRKKNSKYIINKIFSKKKIFKNFPESINHIFFEILSINEIDNFSYFNKYLDKKFQKNKINNKFNLKNRIKSNNIKTNNLWKINKFYKIFLSNYSFLFNPAYEILQINKKNYLKKRSNLVFDFISFFSIPFLKYKKIKLFYQFMYLKKKDNIDILLTKYNKISKNFFIKKIKYKTKSQKLQKKKILSIKDNKNIYLINNILFDNIQKFKYKKQILYLNNSIKKIFHTIFNSLLNKSFLLKKNYIFNEYLKIWENFCKYILFTNFENKIYIEYIFHIKKSVNNQKTFETFSFSKKFVLNKIFFSKKVKKNILKYSEIFPKIINDHLTKKLFFSKKKPINENITICCNNNKLNIFLIQLFIQEKNNEFCIKFFDKSFPIYINKEVLFNPIKKKQLLETFFFKKNFNFVDYLQIPEFNYNYRFFFHLEKNYFQKYNILYLRLLKTFINNNKIRFSIYEINPVLKKIYNNKIIKTNLFNCFSFSKNNLCDDNFFDISKNLTLNNSKEKSKNYKNIIYKQCLKTNIKKNIKPKINNFQIKSFYNILFSELYIKYKTSNLLLFNWNNQYIFYSKKKPKKKIPNKLKKNITSISKKNPFKTINFFTKNIKIQNYNSWFFTLEWWEYNTYLLLEKFQESFFKITDFFEYFRIENIQVIQKKTFKFLKNPKNFLKNTVFFYLNFKWKLRFFNQINKKKVSLKFLWSDFQSKNNWTNIHWAVFSLVAFIFLSYQKIFSIFIGSDFLNLWKNVEIIKYLTDSSRGFYFTKLMRRNKVQLNKTENLLSYFFQNLIHYITNIKFYLLTKKNLKKWLVSNKSLDLSRRDRKLLVQSLITQTQIKEYGFQFYSNQQLINSFFGYQITNQRGLLYLQYLSKIFQKNLINNSLYLANKWIFLSFWQKIFYSQTLWQTKNFDLGLKKIPIPLQFGLSYSKGILLIGSIEAGRSFLIKNLAADSYVPLLKISINKLLYNKPDVITESWMNILIESLRRLNLTLDFAKKMSPCIVWIQNIHQLNVNRLTQNVESDPTFLLGILLKYFQTDFSKTQKNKNIMVIGSTHLPKKVDPALISPNRLDKIINLRLFNISQRKEHFSLLLKKKFFILNQNFLYLNEFGSRTMGYNLRDLTALTNEVLLISITKSKLLINNNILKLAFHRQIFGFTYTNNKYKFQEIYKTLIYKVGKTIIQNILIKNYSINFLNISNFLWKKKFYYLSKWYLEPSIDQSIIKELTILTHVLGCLAGTAAQDSWFLLQQKNENLIPIDKLVENDFTLVFSILENLFSEFPWLEICKNNFINYKQNNSFHFPTKNSLKIMQNGIFAISKKRFMNDQNSLENTLLTSQQKNLYKNKIYDFKKTTWSPRVWRLSFFRSHLFDWIKRPNNFEFSYHLGSLKKKESKLSGNLQKKKKEQFIYERILPRIRKRNVQELESQFEEILLEEQFEILGFFRLSTEYPMEYQLYNKPRLFIGKRILWDPIGLFFQIRHFIFSRREFFVDEEMLRRLYVTYGARRERERSRSSQKIKQFFLCRGYKKDLIDKLSIRWWNQLPVNEKQNINTLKRMEQIGIQLKRPQIFTPVYLYQRWLIENSPEKFLRFELLNNREKWLKVNSFLLNDSFIYTTLLESYQYLLNFFLCNKILLNQMTKLLLKKGWLFENEIENIIHNKKF